MSSFGLVATSEISNSYEILSVAVKGRASSVSPEATVTSRRLLMCDAGAA